MNAIYLSRQARNTGLINYFRHVFLNEIGFNFLSGPIIFLLAIQLNASNLQLGYLSSGLYLTGVVILIVPTLFGGISLMNTYWGLCILRSAVCTLYLVSGWLYVNESAYAVWVLLLGYSLFAVLRNLAWPIVQTVEQILMPANECGKHISKKSIRISSSLLISNLVCFIVLSISFVSPINNFMMLLLIGILLHSLSAVPLRRIPIEQRIEEKQSGGVMKATMDMLKAKGTFPVVVLYWGSIVLKILFAFSIPYMKTLMNIPVNIIFGYVVLTAIACFASSKIVSLFADKLGSRPLLACTFFMSIIISFVWTYLPSSSSWTLAFSIGCLTVFVQNLFGLLISRMVLRVMPDKNKVSFTSMINFYAAIIALFAGLGAGRTADVRLFEVWGLPHLYSPVFVIMAVLSIAMFLICLICREKGSLSIRKTGKIFLSTNNLKTFIMIDKLSQKNQPLKEKQILLRLSHSSSELATDEIRKLLHSPLIRKKSELIESLFFNPRMELLDDIIAEASDPDSWWRQSAIFALGAYPDPKTQEVLRQIYHEETFPLLRSIVAKSLGRIGDVEVLDDLKQMLLYRENLNVNTIINLLIAIGLMDKEQQYLNNIFEIATMRDSDKFKQHIYIIISRRLGIEIGLEEFYFHENTDPLQGFTELLEEVVEFTEFAGHSDAMQVAFEKKDYQPVIALCVELAKNSNPQKRLRYLREGIMVAGTHTLKSADVIALIYFTHSLLKYHSKNNVQLEGKSY